MQVGNVSNCLRPFREQNSLYCWIPLGVCFWLSIKFIFLKLPRIYTSWSSKFSVSDTAIKCYSNIRFPNFHELIKRLENLSNLISKCSNLFDFVMHTDIQVILLLYYLHFCLFSMCEKLTQNIEFSRAKFRYLLGVKRWLMKNWQVSFRVCHENSQAPLQLYIRRSPHVKTKLHNSYLCRSWTSKMANLKAFCLTVNQTFLLFWDTQ